jgi:nucleoside-diphosphate-sugar epimerase
MKILIVGGTGNISSETARALLEKGHDVTLLTRGTTAVEPPFGHLRADRYDPLAYGAALKNFKADCVVNFLGFTPVECRLDHELFRGKIGQYIFISSATVYRKPHTRLPITEDSPLGNPYSEYAQNKLECEEFLRSVQGPDFPVTVVRPSHTFGRAWIPSPLAGSDYTVAARILTGRPIIVHDSGQSLWTLTACSDFARGLAALAGNAAALGETFHITSDQPLTWNCIYQEIGLALGRQAAIEYIPSPFLAEVYPAARAKLLGDKAEHGVFDNRKIKSFAPEFECVKTFRTAIRESVAWYDEDPIRKKVNPEQDRLQDDLIARWRATR